MPVVKIGTTDFTTNQRTANAAVARTGGAERGGRFSCRYPDFLAVGIRVGTVMQKIIC